MYHLCFSSNCSHNFVVKVSATLKSWHWERRTLGKRASLNIKLIGSFFVPWYFQCFFLLEDVMMSDQGWDHTVLSLRSVWSVFLKWKHLELWDLYPSTGLGWSWTWDSRYWKTWTNAQCDYKPHQHLKMKAGNIHYLLIQVYCYARFGKIAPGQTEIDFLVVFMLRFNLLKPNLFNKTAFFSS